MVFIKEQAIRPQMGLKRRAGEALMGGLSTEGRIQAAVSDNLADMRIRYQKSETSDQNSDFLISESYGEAILVHLIFGLTMMPILMMRARIGCYCLLALF